jgi:hypothetical protein
VKSTRIRRTVGALSVGVLLAVGLGACEPPAGSDVPIIFVHGYLGSGAQYESEAKRFASNLYDPAKIRAFDYGTLQVDASALNAFIDGVRAEFNVPKVNLVSHSLGTAVVTGFVGDPANAAKVNKFILVDGVGCPAGNTSCLEIRAAAMGQTHVEASTSPESFAQQYKFFTGEDPHTTMILPAIPELVEIGGKVLDLQVNTPTPGTTGEVWEVDGATGHRVGNAAVGSFTVGTDGSFGPIKVNGNKFYEIAVKRTGATQMFHFYHQPFTRSDYLLRLTTVAPDSAIATNTNTGADHSALVVVRYREWWRSHGAANDTLQITTTVPGQAPVGPVDVFKNVTGDVVGVHIHDDKDTPGVSSLATLPAFAMPFQNGVDVFMPAASPPTGTISVVNAPRGDTTKLQTLNVPNWASSTDVAELEFNDYVQ